MPNLGIKCVACRAGVSTRLKYDHETSTCASKTSPGPARPSESTMLDTLDATRAAQVARLPRNDALHTWEILSITE